MLNGILVIDKDQGMTSADVVYHLRKILHIKKIGHAGTLDPDVTGVLPVAIGQATKLIELMHKEAKSYEGSGLFAYATDSYDTSGQVLARKAVTQKISATEIKNGMAQFLGEIEQVPPIYSAVKVNGKKLYEYARAGISVKRPKREVEIFQYDLTSEPKFDQQAQQENFNFKIKCSKGTYVRSLVNDLGEKLGYPCVMTSLRRTASAGFNLNDAIKLADLAQNPALVDQVLQPIDSFFKTYPQIDLTQSQWQKVKNGAFLHLKTDEKKVALRYNKRVKAIYQRVGQKYRPDLMLLANE